MNYVELSKEISYALRHAPHEYGLNLDAEGWIGLEQLIDGLREKEDYKDVSEQDIVTMIEKSKKKRHECINGRIRALYGHTLEQKITKEAIMPPGILYHGTARRFLDNIMKQGLLSQKRQYVHLSEDIEIAKNVGKRHDNTPIILRINSASAYSDGILFFYGNEGIWLSNDIPPQYLEIY